MARTQCSPSGSTTMYLALCSHHRTSCQPSSTARIIHHRPPRPPSDRSIPCIQQMSSTSTLLTSHSANLLPKAPPATQSPARLRPVSGEGLHSRQRVSKSSLHLSRETRAQNKDRPSYSQILCSRYRLVLVCRGSHNSNSSRNRWAGCWRTGVKRLGRQGLPTLLEAPKEPTMQTSLA